MSDVLKFGLATLVLAARPEDEALVLDAGQVARVADLVWREQFIAWGLLESPLAGTGGPP